MLLYHAKCNLISAYYYCPCLLHSFNILTSRNQNTTGGSTPERLSICLVTAYIPNPSLKYPEIVIKNHQNYAETQGYQNIVITNAVVDKTVAGQWTKIVAINRVLGKEEGLTTVTPDWIVWLDSDAVVIDLNVRIEDVIQHYQNINPKLEGRLISSANMF